MPATPRKKLDFTPVAIPAMALVRGAALRQEIFEAIPRSGLPQGGQIIVTEACLLAGKNNEFVVFSAQVRRGRRTSREVFLLRRRNKRFTRLNFTGDFGYALYSTVREPTLCLADDKVTVKIDIINTKGVCCTKSWQVPPV